MAHFLPQVPFHSLPLQGHLWVLSSSSPPLPPSVPSSGPTNVSALATTSSSMLVRWSEIPEADRNGLVLGYRVSPGYKARRPGLCMGFPAEVPCPRDPPGPRSLPSESTQGICLVARPPVTMAS